MNRFFAPGEEFARIERLFTPDRFSRDGRGLGDDAFVWEPAPGSTWVAASDASAEGVHYRLDWTTPAEALRKALLANLSDMNAMGGRARLVLFNLGARADWGREVFDELGAVLRELEAAHGFRIAGGDTTSIPGSGFFSFTVLGVVDGVPLLRSGVRPGHRVYVSGSLGGSSAGLALRRENRPAAGDAERSLIAAHDRPAPPLDLGPLLASLNRADGRDGPGDSIAAIDVSDGLSSELWHLSRQSGCALRVDAGAIPAHPALAGRPRAAIRDHLLHGGEEYQLLFTGTFSAAELGRLRALAPVTEIGFAEAGDGVFLREDGYERTLEAGGFQHTEVQG